MCAHMCLFPFISSTVHVFVITRLSSSFCCSQWVDHVSALTSHSCSGLQYCTNRTNKQIVPSLVPCTVQPAMSRLSARFKPPFINGMTVGGVSQAGVALCSNSPTALLYLGGTVLWQCSGILGSILISILLTGTPSEQVHNCFHQLLSSADIAVHHSADRETNKSDM